MNIHKQRVLNLAVALREGNPKDFSMGAFFHKCGTPACVIGHYAARRDLQDFLAYDLRSDLRLVETGRGVWHDDPAVADHFGITTQDCWDLFNSLHGCGRATTPEQAIRYIEAFAEQKWPEPKRDPVADLMARVMGAKIPEAANPLELVS